MTRPHPNAHLIGKADARQRLATPALILDRSTLEQNLALGARLAASAGKMLRPHFKAHKSLEIARRQLDLGAVGISVATVSEAEVVSELGADILLTSIISTQAQHRRIADLAATSNELMAVVDGTETLLALEAELMRCDTKLSVLIDIDMGRGRSGCVTETQALDLARLVIGSERFRFRGVQAYAGQLSHMCAFVERKAAHRKTIARIDTIKNALVNHWPADAIISGGSTGSIYLDLNGPLTELQCGSYALMDREYLEVEPGWDTWPFQPAVFVQSAVLSANWDDHVVTDAGDKWFRSKYDTNPIVVTGTDTQQLLELMSDEHAQLPKNDALRLKAGDRIECIPPHCDPTIGLYSAYHVCDDDELLEMWGTRARGE